MSTLQPGPPGPVVISSHGHPHHLVVAMEALQKGADPLDAVVAAVTTVEDDPDVISVGYGGLPNEEGVVELDASVMHGPTHRAGAVAALRNIRHPARVALEVLRRTDHVMLAGEGALAFAKAAGFGEEDLLTERARRAWLSWRSSRAPRDDRLDQDQRIRPDGVPFTEGTIHCSALDADGQLGACTSTSGTSYKLPGRVGDSPLVGAGLFLDNEVGSAGAVGRGEAVMQACAAFQAVRNMGDGLDPSAACLQVVKWIADHTRRPALLNHRGQPRFQVVLYALRRDGVCGGAVMRGGASVHVHDADGIRKVPCARLF